MNDHIDFVNDVYEKVETPMNFIVTKFNKMIGNDVQLIE
jgi:phenolic acid decarboxylase